MIRAWRERERLCTRETATSTNLSHFVLFLTTNRFFRFHYRINVWLQNTLYSTHTHTGTYSQEVAVFSFLPSTLPPVPLSHKCILLLISWLHICLLVVFFSINKALIAFSLECDLAHCVLSFWGCWPWRTRLDYYTAAQSTGCYQTRALSQVPRSRHTAAKTQRRRCRTKTDANGPCNTQTHTHTHWLHGTMAEEKQCIFQVQTEEERRWTWGQSGRKVEIWGQIRPPASSQTW